MAIANASTTVPVAKTAAEIQMMLSVKGALAVLIEYDKGVPSSVSFRILVNEQELHFRLPSNWRGVYGALQRSNLGWKNKTEEQAQRVAWRIIRDWLRAQLALIEAGCAEMEEVMLPYMELGAKTVYQHLKERGFKALPAPEAV